MLGFGDSAKVVDFTDGRGMRIRHLARFCALLGIDSAHFVGNSMGAINLLVDMTSESPVLPVRSAVTICGGGEIQKNRHTTALYEYDATYEAMRAIVEALFFDPGYPADEAYVQRRYESSIAPGAWESLAAARFFRRPGLDAPSTPVEQAGVRAHRCTGPGRRGCRRQAPAVGLGRRDRQADLRRSFGCHQERRTLPTDRAARRDGGAPPELLRPNRRFAAELRVVVCTTSISVADQVPPNLRPLRLNSCRRSSSNRLREFNLVEARDSQRQSFAEIDVVPASSRTFAVKRRFGRGRVTT